MEMRIDFPGGTRVAARFGDFTVQTDLPVRAGGEGSAPTPFDIFLASLGTCAGVYVLGYCRQRGLPVAGLQLIQRVRFHEPTAFAEKISLEIVLPPDFPEEHREGVIRAASQCKVKRHLEKPPEFEILTSISLAASV